MTDDIKRIISIVEPIVREEGCELIDAEVTSDSGRKILRLYIDKNSGVILDDCARVSHAVEDILEVEDAISGCYNLEVSSPGVERPLRTREHFEKAMGHRVHVTTRDKVGDRRNFIGLLKGLETAQLIIMVDGQDFLVQFEQVMKARIISPL